MVRIFAEGEAHTIPEKDQVIVLVQYRAHKDKILSFMKEKGYSENKIIVFNNRKAKMKQKTLKDFNDQAYSPDEYKKKANKESKKFRDLRKQKRSQNWFW